MSNKNKFKKDREKKYYILLRKKKTLSTQIFYNTLIIPIKYFIGHQTIILK